jgi:hypothetical protein
MKRDFVVPLVLAGAVGWIAWRWYKTNSAGTTVMVGGGALDGLLSLMGDGVSKLDALANAMFDFEGGSAGEMNVRNNNPGNLMYAGQPGATKGAGGFAVFSTLDAGFNALKNQLKLDTRRNPDWTLKQEIAKWLGGNPKNIPSDGVIVVGGKVQGNVNTYAATVAKAIGASITSTLKELVG